MKVEIDDEPLFDYLDSFIENLPLEVLEQARLNTIKENGDTSILDQAIRNKKEKESKNKTFLFDFFFSKKDKNTKSNDNYELYQFEEEELEEDDYYYEDLD